MQKKKVVFIDAGREKVAKGTVTRDGVFIVVTDETGRTIQIHQNRVVFIRDLDGGC
jgi:hypothetical protein